jgi:hypothetical protein
MGFALSSIVMMSNLVVALFVFSCLSRPQRFLLQCKRWNILYAKHPELQRKEVKRLGEIFLVFLFLFSIICGVILAIIQNNIP